MVYLLEILVQDCDVMVFLFMQLFILICFKDLQPILRSRMMHLTFLDY